MECRLTRERSSYAVAAANPCSGSWAGVNGVRPFEPAAELLVLGGDTFFQCPRCWGRNHVARQGKGLTISGFTPSLLLTNRLAHDKRSA